MSAVFDIPTIGISGAYDADLSDYEAAIVEGGGRPIILRGQMDTVERDFSTVQGLLLTGGRSGRLRNLYEMCLITRFAQSKLPILGIGSGLHVMNAALGGTVIDLRADTFADGVSLVERMVDFADQVVHIAPESSLATIIGLKLFLANTPLKTTIDRVSSQLRVAARTADRIIVALESGDTEHFCIGVSWHPELDLDAAPARALFRAFVNASRRDLSC